MLETPRNVVLHVDDVSKNFGGLQALSDIDFTVEEGMTHAIIGPNGAGKSTLLNALIGALPARGGVAYRGRDIGGLALEERVMQGLALVPETRALFGTMSVEDNLQLGAYRQVRLGHRDSGAAMARVFGLFPRLEERRAQLAGTLSGGERQMLAVGRALMSQPTLLMLDEPSLGLAPLVVREIFRTIAALRETGVTILLVEQNARAALEVADHGYVLEMGEVVLEGPAADLARDPRVIDTYLGARRRDEAGNLILQYRPWLVLPRRTLALPQGQYAIGQGLFYSQIMRVTDRGLSAVMLLPPRYRGHEQELVTIYGLSGVRDAGLRAVGRWLRETLPFRAQAPAEIR